MCCYDILHTYRGELIMGEDMKEYRLQLFFNYVAWAQVCEDSPDSR